MGPILGQSNKQQIYCQFEGLVPKIVREVWLVLSNDAVVTFKKSEQVFKRPSCYQFSIPSSFQLFPYKQGLTQFLLPIPRKINHPVPFFNYATWWPAQTQQKKAPGKPIEHQKTALAEESFRSVHFRSSTSIAQQESRPSTYGGQRMELTGWSSYVYI